MTLRKSLSGNFAVGTSETDAIQLNELYTLTGVIITGSYTSGSLMSFLGSDDGTNFYPIYNSSSLEITITTTSASRCYSINPDDFLGYNFIKARLGSSGSAKNQATQPQPIIFTLKTIK
jgi:hypothetical protein